MSYSDNSDLMVQTVL